MKRILLTLLLIGLLPLSQFAQTPTEEPQYIMKVHLKGEQPILVPVDKIDSVQFIVSELVREFTLSPEQVELQVGDTRQLTVVVTPADANYSVSYESNDATVATVTAEGLVQALAAGTATITATIGKLQKQCSVTVLAPAQPTRPKLAIEYLAPYDINPEGTGFATSHSNDASGLFAMWRAETIMEQDFLKDYHMGKPTEWLGIFPAYTNIRLIDFFRKVDYLDIEEKIEIHGELGDYKADYRNMGDALTYAIRFKGGDNSQRAAYRYEGIGEFDENDLTSHVRVTVRYLGPDFTGTIDDIATADYWSKNTEEDIVRTFPCSGYSEYADDYGNGAVDALTNRGMYGGYLCKPAQGADKTCNVSYGFNTCAVFVNDTSGSSRAWQLRPFTND